MKRRYFIALLIAGSAAGGAARLAVAAPNEVDVIAEKFDFTPDTIKAKVGRPLTLVLTSIDRVHGFKMPDFGVQTEIVPSEETRITITPTRPGTFAFFCDIFCGDGHEEMAGTLVVEA